MLSLLGKGYVIDHYISFFTKDKEEESYKIYVTNTLQSIARNTASKEGDIYINVKWIDIVSSMREKRTNGKEKEDDETKAEKIITNVKKKLAIIQKGGKV